jgi:phosphoribosylglycinamide formyltransferase-1
MTLKIAALASGTGSNVKAILDNIEAGRLDARVVALLSDNPSAKVLHIAQARGVPVWAKDFKDYPDRESFDRAMLEVIQAHGADTIVLAGYMRLLSPLFVRTYPWRILNIHPALLPSFAGLHGPRDALEYGVKVTGVSVHFVEEGMDTGPLIIQAAVPVRAIDSVDSLHARIQLMEHRIYPQALQWLAEGRLRIEGRRVRRVQAARPNVTPASHGNNALGPWMVCPALEGF